MVYGIVKNHDGYIRARSRKGRGSVFDIYFPLTAKSSEEQLEASAKTITGNETILVVDDEELMRDLLDDMLSELEYKVLTAHDGPSAIKIYKELHNDIDLIILDMVMPKMKGIDVFRWLKKTDPNVKVILSSGYSRAGEAREILEEGVLDFIQKPFKQEDLSRIIRSVLDKK